VGGKNGATTNSSKKGMPDGKYRGSARGGDVCDMGKEGGGGHLKTELFVRKKGGRKGQQGKPTGKAGGKRGAASEMPFEGARRRTARKKNKK